MSDPDGLEDIAKALRVAADEIDRLRQMLEEIVQAAELASDDTAKLPVWCVISRHLIDKARVLLNEEEDQP